MAEPWTPGTPEYESWARQNATKTGTTAPGFDQFGMPLNPAPRTDYGVTLIGGGTTTPPTGTTAAQKSAKAIINSALEQYGLGSLGDRLWNDYLGGTPMEQIFLTMRETPEHKIRFPWYHELAKKGRAITEAQGIELERTYAQIMRQAGMPPGLFDDPSDFAAWISGEVAPTEVRDRVAMASAAANQAPKEVRDELARLYGVDQGGLTAFFLSPERTLPVLTQQFAAGTLSAAARRTGYGALDKTEAERLASLGVSEEAAQRGFGELARSSELMTSLDAGEDTIDRATGQAAVFEGNAAAIERLNRRAQRRRAQFESGGGFAAGREGITGLASAQT